MNANRRPSGPDLSRRRFLAASGAVGLGAILSACGGGSNSPSARSDSESNGGASGYDGPAVELAFWNGFTGGDGPVMKELVDEFNTEHENIAVSMTVMEWADYYEKLPPAVQSGKGPDVAIMHMDSLATNAARNVIVPLDDIADALELAEADFSPAVWQAGIFNGQRFGIPLDVHPLGFFYNKAVMADAGLNPDDPPTDRTSYEAALETLASAGVQGHWMSPFAFTGGQTLQSLIWQFGGSSITLTGRR